MVAFCWPAPGSCGTGMARGRDRHVPARREGPREKTLHAHRRREGALLSPGKQSPPSRGFLCPDMRLRGLGAWYMEPGFWTKSRAPICTECVPCSRALCPGGGSRGPREMLGRDVGVCLLRHTNSPALLPLLCSLPAPSPAPPHPLTNDGSSSNRPLSVPPRAAGSLPGPTDLAEALGPAALPRGPCIHLQGQQSHVQSHPCSCLLCAP